MSIALRSASGDNHETLAYPSSPLGVTDLERSLAFYRATVSALPTRGIVGREFEHGAVAFFELSRWAEARDLAAQDDLAHDSGLTKAAARRRSRSATTWRAAEVDGGGPTGRRRRSSSPQDTFSGGYAGYFRDPSGHLWEVVVDQPAFPTGEWVSHDQSRPSEAAEGRRVEDLSDAGKAGPSLRLLSSARGMTDLRPMDKD